MHFKWENDLKPYLAHFQPKYLFSKIDLRHFKSFMGLSDWIGSFRTYFARVGPQVEIRDKILRTGSHQYI